MTDGERQTLVDNGWELVQGFYFQDHSVTGEIFYADKAVEIQRERKPRTTSTTERSSTVETISAVSIVAQDILHAFDPVTITGRLANSSNSAHYGKVIGLVANDLGVGFSGNVIVEGLVTNGSWAWTPGSSVYLNGTGLSQIAPSTLFSQQIGIAKTSTTLYIDVGIPILL